MKGWMEEVRQLADQYTDPQSASMKRALFKISFSFFLMPTILITYKMFCFGIVSGKWFAGRKRKFFREDFISIMDYFLNLWLNYNVHLFAYSV